MNWSDGSGVRNIHVICGPTAAGKSAVAMAIAERTGALVISADSRQVYRQFNIGTAKPSHADRALVPHEGIDIVEPTERYSAAAWVSSALHWLHDAESRGQRVIVVGGTGFYLRALDTPLFDAPAVDAEERVALLAQLDMQSTEALRERCAVIDPARAHLGRTQLLRAVETFELTGRPLSAWVVERSREPEVQAHYLLVDPGAALRERIAARVHGMLAEGWEDEVAALAETVPIDAPAWNACGYARIRDALRGRGSRADAVERTIIETRQYAKRQRTWFRHQLPADRVTQLDPASPDATQRAMSWFQTHHLPEPL
jgi:tRNA dimethylallyltransferase